MVDYYYDKGMTLYEGLQEVYKKYGYYKEELKSITLKGIERYRWYGKNKVYNELF